MRMRATHLFYINPSTLTHLYVKVTKLGTATISYNVHDKNEPVKCDILPSSYNIKLMESLFS